MNIGIIGLGKMAKAIFSGAIDKGIISASQLYVYTRTSSSYDGFADEVNRCTNAEEVFLASELVFLCVKPQSFTDVCAGLLGAETAGKTVVSIMAGVKSTRIIDMLGVSSVVRAMPNTPIMLGEGCTALCANREADPVHFALVKEIFAALGMAFELDEALFDAVIPVNGSGPAFIYLFAKLIAERADKYGIESNQALKMFAQTLIGSGKMILTAESGIDELISNVCSKGGTTIAALEAMNDAGFATVVNDGFDACVKRSKELSGS